MELQNLYAALAQPTDGLTVSYPISDVNGAQLRPAFVVERLGKLFPDNRLERESGEKEYRLSAIAPALESAGQDPGGPVWRWFAEKPDWAERLTAMKRAAAMTRPKEKLILLHSLYHTQSALKRLTSLAACPVPPETAAGCRSYGEWLLLPLLCRLEAKPLRDIAGVEPENLCGGDESPWQVFLHDIRCGRTERGGKSGGLHPQPQPHHRGGDSGLGPWLQ